MLWRASERVFARRSDLPTSLPAITHPASPPPALPSPPLCLALRARLWCVRVLDSTGLDLQTDLPSPRSVPRSRSAVYSIERKMVRGGLLRRWGGNLLRKWGGLFPFFRLQGTKNLSSSIFLRSWKNEEPILLLLLFPTLPQPTLASSWGFGRSIFRPIFQFEDRSEDRDRHSNRRLDRSCERDLRRKGGSSELKKVFRCSSSKKGEVLRI